MRILFKKDRGKLKEQGEKGKGDRFIFQHCHHYNLGSTIAMTDSTGNIVNKYAYASVISMYNYTMDPSGNRTGATSYQPLDTAPPSQNISYTYNDDNRLMSAGATTFTYDVRGNLLTKTGSTYTWNVRNLLNTVTTGGSTYTYKYDPIGNRIARIVGSTETRYVVAGGTLLAETNKQGAITAYYVYGLGMISKVTPAGAAVAEAAGVAVPAVIVGAEVSRLGSSLRRSQTATTAAMARPSSATPPPAMKSKRFRIQSSGGLLGFRDRYAPAPSAGSRKKC